jgi:molybdopterin-guanine dinucleotide biosynthesis protein A
MKGGKSRISGVILAGGTGKRFGGKAKYNIIVSGKTIISRMLEVLSDIFDEILIVTANNNQDKFEGFRVIHDEFVNIGPLGGVHVSLKQSEADAIFVFAGDMPLLNKEIILKQLELFSRTEPGILVPRYRDYIEPLHSIFNISILPELEKFIKSNTNHPVYELFKIAGANYFDLENTQDTINSFLNINTPEDVFLAEKILANRS